MNPFPQTQSFGSSCPQQPPNRSSSRAIFLRASGCLAGTLLSLSTAPSGRTADAERPSPFSEKAEFYRYAERLRENALQSLEPKVRVPSSNPNLPPPAPLSGGAQTFRSQSFYQPPPPGFQRPGLGYQSTPFSPSTSYGPSAPLSPGRYPWKSKIVTTVFWVGESASVNNPVHNRSSCWDQNWKESFGGSDSPDPAKRRGWIPAGFIPKLNPFYCALPYNDVGRGGHRPEARAVIPWFRQTFVRDGQSVCRDRWVAIRNNTGRICYAQWSDCGPFRTDHWEYVFGSARPAPNLNRGAGLDVSPAVRDYLKLNSIDVTDWKFVEFHEIPRGPWADHGENNEFVQLARRSRDRIANSAGETGGPRVMAR